ncbi:S-adenosyl-L-methionine-dependent methyltransferase [Ascodesmis nigricans]|uniref:S-adenosyl-L-methionine-dependent methyltransferase n=1 Tax=Ascodesmis nigricans TaxID=341454 RepID=A0A4S2MRR6_9PEZI|nr:S-adenosyl-L-methionine-dependent methyltransferase [Ascodesmis nigricans]
MYLEMLSGRLTLTPYETLHPRRVLDCGTGTGMNPLYRHVHPDTEVLGVDLVPIQPVRFEVDDLELEWLFPENHFDFIHSRDLVTAIKDWPRYFAHMYKHLSSGGYVEISEHSLDTFRTPDSTHPPNSCYTQWLTALTNSLTQLGAHPSLTLRDYSRLLRDAGFVDIEEYEFQVPVGTWPRDRGAKRLGGLFVENAKTGFEAYGKNLMLRGGGEEGEVERVIRECGEEMRRGRWHVYYLHWHIVARKP